MFGAHLSIAGGLHNALLEARRLTMDCVQVFTKNQKIWAPPPLLKEAVQLFEQHRRETKVGHVVSHDSYLINLASVDKTFRPRSIALFRDELERCEALGIPDLVMHPGCHMGIGEEEGLRLVAEAFDQIHADLPGHRTITCIEVTAGQGSSLGYKFEHIRRILELVKQPERLAVCLDTAHLLAAGYDLTSEAGAKATLREFDKVVGLKHVRVLHINDSKVPRGKRVDRHEHIGKGHVSLDAFRAIVNFPRFKRLPKVLETPKDDGPEGRPWDEVNLETLRNLCKILPEVCEKPARRRRP